MCDICISAWETCREAPSPSMPADRGRSTGRWPACHYWQRMSRSIDPGTRPTPFAVAAPRLIRAVHRVMQTLAPMQNRDGGFGGGHGQMSHCATSYAAVLSLAMVGGDEALEMIDRKALYVPCASAPAVVS